MNVPAGVETFADAWGLPPNAPDHPEQLPPSTFAPPPANAPASDFNAVYGDLIAQLDALELWAVTLRYRHYLFDFAEPVETP